MDLHIQPLPANTWPHQKRSHEIPGNLASVRFCSGHHYLLASSSASMASSLLLPRNPCASPSFRGRCKAEGKSSGPVVSPDKSDIQSPTDPYSDWVNLSDAPEYGSAGMRGWLKLGSIAVLAIGFTLGACFVYTRQAATRGFAAPHPVKEQIINSTTLKEMKKELVVEEDEPRSEDIHLKEKYCEDLNSDAASSTAIFEGARQQDAVVVAQDESSDLGVGSPERIGMPLVALQQSFRHENGSTLDMPAMVTPMSTVGTSATATSLSTSLMIANKDEVSDEVKANMMVDHEKELNATNDIEEITFVQEHPMTTADDQSMQFSSTPLIPPADEDMPDQCDEFLRTKDGALEQLFSRTGFIAPILLAGSHKTLGKVVVPPSVDHAHEQALAALKALKVIEADVQPADICTRREYARWMIRSSDILSRSPAYKVFPAMYIEGATTLAFDDVLPDDLDFSSIQGLAEAGLISSRLLADDIHGSTGTLDEYDSNFFSDSPLMRQDLITWKVALERKLISVSGIPSTAGEEASRAVSGFIDLEKIDHSALPALLIDLSAGERSIFSSAFGYTRRFQPEKPVTKAQAAVALASGDTRDLVSEDLARLEAESIAEATMAAELVLEKGLNKDTSVALDELLQAEREKQEAMVKAFEETQAELTRLKALRDEESILLSKERAALNSERELFATLRRELQEQALALSDAKAMLTVEKAQIEKVLLAAEEEKEAMSKVRAELEIEKSALVLARNWAEEEARKAAVHANVLEEARKRWEYKAEPRAIDELNEINSGEPTEVGEKRKLITEIMVANFRAIGNTIANAWIKFFGFVMLVFSLLKMKTFELAQILEKGLHAIRENAFNSVGNIHYSMPNSLAVMTSTLREGMVKAVNDCKGGAERLAVKLKMQ